MAFEKDYIHRGTQTDFPSSPLRRPSTRSSIQNLKSLQVQSRVHDGYLSSSSQNVSNSNSTQLDNAYSHSLSAVSNSIGLSPGTISSRVSKRRQLTYNRPTEFYKPANRLVSLPETVSLYSIRTEMDSTALRVVSMPERDRRNVFTEKSSTSDYFEVSASSDNSYLTADDELYSHLRVASDLPNTPSPPSSPESVMIIANNTQLPEAFLRHKAAPSQPLNDEGWITWASSPPRPIPALHGPLSLPYARCPSGAEGTIVEGPDDLSRMIWGLGADDSQPSHPRDTSAPQKAVIHLQSNFPPRLQKPQHSQNYIAHKQRPLSNAPIRSAPVISDFDTRADAVLHQRALETLGTRLTRNKFIGANALDNLLHTGATADPWNPIYRDSFIEDLRNFDMQGGLKLDWRPTTEHQGLQDSGHKAGLHDYLQPSVPGFVAASQSAQHSYPRIFVEPRPHETSQITLPPPRLSAIEIAHKYRQQQQLQNALPTPPSSSFSHWSPYFSSRQEVSISPDPVIARSSRLPTSQIQLQQHLPTGSSHQLRRSVYQNLGYGPLFDNAKLSRGAPSQISQTTWSQPTSHCYPDSKVVHLSPSLVSPPQPGPPPNTPLPPVPASARDAKYCVSRSVSAIATPPSPICPEARARSLSYQQPRSIPLARLIQRRLSSVPEEDLSSVAERARSPPSGPQPKLKPVHSMKGQHHLRPSVYAQHPRAPSPNSAILNSQTRSSDDLDLAVFTVDANTVARGTSEAMRPTVKLPYKPTNSDMKGRYAQGRAKTGKDKGGDITDNLAATKEGIPPKKKTRGRKVKTSAPAQTTAKNDCVKV